jgi:hypothetical protein
MSGSGASFTSADMPVIMVVADVSAGRMDNSRTCAEAVVHYFRIGSTLAVGTVAIM